MQTISFWDIMILNVFLLKDKRTDWGCDILFEYFLKLFTLRCGLQQILKNFHFTPICVNRHFSFFFFYWRQGTKRKVKIFIRIMQNAWDMICTHYILLEDNCSNFNLKWQTSDKIHISILLQDSAAHIDYRCKTKLGNQLF